MTQAEAVANARAFVLASTGVDADPDSVRPVTGPAHASAWYVRYTAAHFFPEVAAGRATVDGGEYLVIVDDVSCRVSGFDPLACAAPDLPPPAGEDRRNIATRR